MESNEESTFVNVGNSLSDEFSICNGMGSFVLEDDTPTYSSNDTLSFVVLQSAVASYIDIEQKSKPIDSSSLMASLNSSEVHEKLSELLQENAKLKETLKQNNIAMKQQFSTLTSWQENMMKVHDDHRKKFAETRKLIHHLEEENAELKARVALEGVSQISSHDMPSACETQSNKDFSILDMSLEELEELSNSRQLSAQENQLSMAKGDQKTQAASTKQPAIEMLGEQAPTLQSFVSNYISQSIAKNNPERGEAVDICTNCVKSDQKTQAASTRQPAIEMLGEHAPALQSFVANYISQSITKNNPERVEAVDTCTNCVKGDQKTQAASTRQLAIEMLGEQAPTLQSFVSNYISQSITKNTPECAEAVDTCTYCVKCLKKDEEINALKEIVVHLEHRLQSASICDNRILQDALRTQEIYTRYLESQVKKYEESTTLFKTQLELYEEDFQLERQQKNILKEENDQIHEDLIKTKSSLTED